MSHTRSVYTALFIIESIEVFVDIIKFETLCNKLCISLVFFHCR